MDSFFVYPTDFVMNLSCMYSNTIVIENKTNK